MGRETLGEVWDGLGNARGGPGWIEGPSGKSGTGRGMLVEVRDGSWDPLEVQDGLGDPR